MISVVNPICPCFSHFFRNPILSFFSQNVFALVNAIIVPTLVAYMSLVLKLTVLISFGVSASS